MGRAGSYKATQAFVPVRGFHLSAPQNSPMNLQDWDRQQHAQASRVIGLFVFRGTHWRVDTLTRTPTPHPSLSCLQAPSSPLGVTLTAVPQSLQGHCPGTEGRVHPVHSSCSQLSPRAAGLGAQGLQASGRGCHVPRPRSSCAERPQASRVGTRSLASDGFCYSDLVTRSVAHSPEWLDLEKIETWPLGTHSFDLPAWAWGQGR